MSIGSVLLFRSLYLSIMYAYFLLIYTVRIIEFFFLYTETADELFQVVYTKSNELSLSTTTTI